MLVTTGEIDDHVIPAHTFKFIAQLQYELGSKLHNSPFLARINTMTGRGMRKPISEIVRLVSTAVRINTNIAQRLCDDIINAFVCVQVEQQTDMTSFFN